MAKSYATILFLLPKKDLIDAFFDVVLVGLLARAQAAFDIHLQDLAQVLASDSARGR
jgi:hypothetical protein